MAACSGGGGGAAVGLTSITHTYQRALSHEWSLIHAHRMSVNSYSYHAMKTSTDKYGAVRAVVGVVSTTMARKCSGPTYIERSMTIVTVTR